MFRFKKPPSYQRSLKWLGAWGVWVFALALIALVFWFCSCGMEHDMARPKEQITPAVKFTRGIYSQVDAHLSGEAPKGSAVFGRNWLIEKGMRVKRPGTLRAPARYWDESAPGAGDYQWRAQAAPTGDIIGVFDIDPSHYNPTKDAQYNMGRQVVILNRESNLIVAHSYREGMLRECEPDWAAPWEVSDSEEAFTAISTPADWISGEDGGWAFLANGTQFQYFSLRPPSVDLGIGPQVYNGDYPYNGLPADGYLDIEADGAVPSVLSLYNQALVLAGFTGNLAYQNELYMTDKNDVSGGLLKVIAASRVKLNLNSHEEILAGHQVDSYFMVLTSERLWLIHGWSGSSLSGISIAGGPGSVGRFASHVVSNRLYWMSRGGIYYSESGGPPEKLFKGQDDYYFDEVIDTSRLDRVRTEYDPDKGLLYFFVPTKWSRYTQGILSNGDGVIVVDTGNNNDFYWYDGIESMGAAYGDFGAGAELVIASNAEQADGKLSAMRHIPEAGYTDFTGDATYERDVEYDAVEAPVTPDETRLYNFSHVWPMVDPGGDSSLYIGKRLNYHTMEGIADQNRFSFAPQSYLDMVVYTFNAAGALTDITSLVTDGDETTHADLRKNADNWFLLVGANTSFEGINILTGSSPGANADAYAFSEIWNKETGDADVMELLENIGPSPTADKVVFADEAGGIFYWSMPVKWSRMLTYFDGAATFTFPERRYWAVFVANLTNIVELKTLKLYKPAAAANLLGASAYDRNYVWNSDGMEAEESGVVYTLSKKGLLYGQGSFISMRYTERSPYPFGMAGHFLKYTERSPYR